MEWPDGYTDAAKESIFGHWVGDAEVGSMLFVLTRSHDRLNVYVFQYLGPASADDRGDLILPTSSGHVNDRYYDPWAEDSFLPEDMIWDTEGVPRLSQPVRDWLEERDRTLANLETVTNALLEERVGEGNVAKRWS